MIRSKSSSKRSKLFSAVVATVASAIAGPALAQVQLKPGDVIFGSGVENAAGAGRIYVLDSTDNNVTQIGGNFFNGVGGMAIDNQGNLIVGTQASSTGGAGRLFRISFDSLGVATTTQIGTHQFFNGIDGLAVNPANNQIYVGTSARATNGQGAVYTVNPTTGSATQLGNSPFFNGVGDLEYDAANRRLILGTTSRAAAGTGQLYTVDADPDSLAYGTHARVGPTSGPGQLSYTHGVESIALYYRESVAGVVTTDAVFGTWANNLAGTGRLYRLDAFTNPNTPASWTAAEINPAVTYQNGVTGVDFDFDGNILAGTYSNNGAGFGGLYTVNPVTGLRTLVTPANASSQIFNGVTAVTVVQPQLDFVGGNNVTISNSATTNAMFLQVDPVDGTRGFFSGSSSQNLSIQDLTSAVEVDTTSVRTGIGGSNSEPSNLTVVDEFDYNGIVILPGPQLPELILRAGNDITIAAPIYDSDLDIVVPVINPVQSLDLTLIAASARAFGSGIGTSGVVSIAAPIELNLGDFTSIGKVFENSLGGSISTLGDISLQHTLDVTLSNPFIVSGQVVIGAGDFSNSLDGTISSDGDVLLPASSVSIVATASTSGATGSVTIGAPIITNVFSSTGVDFTNNFSLASIAGNFSILHTGAVVINDDITAAAGNMVIQGNTIINPTANLQGEIVVGGNATLRAVTSINIEHQLTAGNLTVEHLTGGSGLAFTNSAVLDVTSGAISITNAGGVTTFGNNVTSSTLTSVGGDFNSTAAFTTTVAGLAQFNQSGAIALEGNSNVGSVLVQAATNFTLGSGGALVANAGSVDLTLSGAIDLNADLTTTTGSAGNFTATGGTTFDSAGVTVSLDASFIVNQSDAFAINIVNTGGYFSAVTGGNTFSANALTMGGADGSGLSLNIIAPSGIDLNGAVQGTGNLFSDSSAGGGTTTFNTSVNLSGGSIVSNAGFFNLTSVGSIGTGAPSQVGAITIVAPSGTTFDGQIQGNAAMDVASSSGQISVNNAVWLNGSTANFTAGEFTVSGSGTIGVGAEPDDTVGAVTVSITGGSGPSGSYVDVNGAINAGPLTFNTPDFTSTATLNAAGDINFNMQGGAVLIQAVVTTTGGGNLLGNNGSSFDSTSTDILLDGNFIVTQANDYNLNTLTAQGYFSATTGSGQFTSNAFTVNGDNGGQTILIDAPTGITLNGNVAGDGQFQANAVNGVTTINASVGTNGGNFDVSTGEFTVTPGGSLGVFGTPVGATTITTTQTIGISDSYVNIDGELNVGPLTVNAPDIRTNAPITAAGSTNLNMNGFVDFNNSVTLTSGNLVGSGITDFDTIGGAPTTINVQGGYIELTASGIYTLNDTSASQYLYAQTSGGSFTANAITTQGVNGSNQTLYVQAPGSIQFNGIVQGAGDAYFDSDSSAVTVNNTLDLSAGALTVAEAGSFTTTAAGVVGAGNGVGNVNLQITGPVQIGANFTSSTLQSTGTNGSAATFQTLTGITLTTSGLTTITHDGDATIDGALVVGPLTVTVPNITSSATIDVAGTFNLTAADQTNFDANVTTVGGDLVSNTTGNLFDSEGVTVNIGGAASVRRSTTINTGETVVGSTLNLVVDNGGDGIDLNADTTAGSNIAATNFGGGFFESTGTSVHSTGGSVTILNDPGASAGLINVTNVRAGTTMNVTGGAITADGLLRADAGTMNLLVTVGGADTTLSGGVSVNGGATAAFNSTGIVAGGMDFNSTPLPVFATGAVTLNHTGDVTTNNLTSDLSSILITALDTSTVLLEAVDAGTTFTTLSNNLTVNQTVLTGGTIDVTANGGAVDFNGDVTGGGNFRSDGTGATTFDSTTTLVDIAGQSQIVVNNNIDIDRWDTGTSFTATTATGSALTGNTVLSGTTTTITAPGGITLEGGTIGAFSGALRAGGNTTFNALDGAVTLNARSLLTAGSFVNNSVDFNNTGASLNAAPIKLAAATGTVNATFNNNGTVIIGSDIDADSSASTLSFTGAPTVFVDNQQPGAAEGSVMSFGNGPITAPSSPGVWTGGVMNFSGGSVTQVLNQSELHDHTGFVGNGSDGTVTLDGGDELVNLQEVLWWNRANLFVGGSATAANIGAGFLTVGQNARLRVDNTLKVWRTDSVFVQGGSVEITTLDLDPDAQGNNRGIFNFYAGEICFLNNLTLSVTTSIFGVIGEGTGANRKLRLTDDHEICVENNSSMQSTLILDGGTFSTGTITTPRLNLSTSRGTINLNKQDFVVRRIGDSTLAAGTFGDGTQIIPAGLSVNVNSAPLSSNFKTIVKTLALLKFTGGTVDAVKGTTNNGTIQFDDSASLLTGGTLTNNASGLVYGTGEVRANLANAGQVRASNTELLRFTGASNTSSGTLRVINGGAMEFVSGVTVTGSMVGDGVFLGPDNVSITSAPGVVPPTFAGQGIFVQPGGSANFSAKTDIYADFVTSGNFSPLIISSGTATTSFYRDAYFGAIDLNTFAVSTVRVSSVTSKVVFFGLVKGFLNTEGPGEVLFDGGTIDPGFSPGHLSMENATFAAGSKLMIDLGGVTPADDFSDRGLGFYDQANFGTLRITGPMTLDVSLFGGFSPTLGQSFTIAYFDQLIGDPSLVNLSFGGESSNWEATWKSNSLVLTFIPEPGTALLALPLLAALAARRRRR